MLVTPKPIICFWKQRYENRACNINYIFLWSSIILTLALCFHISVLRFSCKTADEQAFNSVFTSIEWRTETFTDFTHVQACCSCAGIYLSIANILRQNCFFTTVATPVSQLLRKKRCIQWTNLCFTLRVAIETSVVCLHFNLASVVPVVCSIINSAPTTAIAGRLLFLTICISFYHIT